MNAFVDLVGASGTSYRFRLLSKGQSPLPTGGNLAILRVSGERSSVVHLIMTNDLSKAVEELPAMPGRRPCLRYARLNIARAVREAEHEDLVARYGQRLAAE